MASTTNKRDYILRRRLGRVSRNEEVYDTRMCDNRETHNQVVEHNTVAYRPGFRRKRIVCNIQAVAETLGMLSMLKDFDWKLGGEIWSDANAAIGVIQRNGLGKIRHIDTGLLWIQRIAAQRRVTFHKVLGEDNPADLYAKYVDNQTANHHLSKSAYQTTSGRAAEAPKLRLISQSLEDMYGINVSTCDWVNAIAEAMSTTKAQLAPWRRGKLVGHVGKSGVKDGKRVKVYDNGRTDVYDLSGLNQQVLWRSKWQLQGPNGSNSAQLDHLQGSTRTFQPIAKQEIGVSWAHGLRHGVTMHPRGRHLREGMILLIHGWGQQPKRQRPYNTNDQWKGYYKAERNFTGGTLDNYLTLVWKRQSLQGRLAPGLLRFGMTDEHDPSIEKFKNIRQETREENPERRKISHCWAVSPQGWRKSDIAPKALKTMTKR